MSKSPKELLFLKEANLYTKFLVLPPRVCKSSKYLWQQSLETTSWEVICFTNQYSKIASELEVYEKVAFITWRTIMMALFSPLSMWWCARCYTFGCSTLHCKPQTGGTNMLSQGLNHKRHKCSTTVPYL